MDDAVVEAPVEMPEEAAPEMPAAEAEGEETTGDEVA